MFESYVSRVTNDKKFQHNGEVYKNQSDMIMNETWWNDIQSQKAYIYDYYHDNDPYTFKNRDPANDPLKTEVDVKFIVSQYETLNNDQVEYHVQFRPGLENPLSYYDGDIGRFGASFPMGLYIDLKDEAGKYNRWLICLENEGNQFIKFSVLPCNYLLHWVYKQHLYDMCVCIRSRNSYSSGIWSDNMTTTVQDQAQIFLPQCELTKNFYYKQRLVVDSRDGVQGLDSYLAWQVTDIKDTFPKGIIKATLYQDLYDPNKDLYDPATGYLYADFASYIEGNKSSQSEDSEHSEISCSGQQNLYVGSAKTVNLKFYDSTNTEITKEATSSDLSDYWSVDIYNNADDASPITENYPISGIITAINNNMYAIKIKLTDYTLIGKTLKLHGHFSDGSCTSTMPFNISSL